jgi:hypothetical protein
MMITVVYVSNYLQSVLHTYWVGTYIFKLTKEFKFHTGRNIPVGRKEFKRYRGSWYLPEGTSNHTEILQMFKP